MEAVRVAKGKEDGVVTESYSGMEPEPEPETGLQGGLRGMVRVLGGKVDGERQTEVQDYQNAITIVMIMDDFPLAFNLRNKIYSKGLSCHSAAKFSPKD